MPAVVVVCVVWFAIVVIAGVIAIAIAPRVTRPRPLHKVTDRWLAATDAAEPSLGRPASGAMLFLAGYGVIYLVGWILGELAHAVEDPIDHPVFHFWRDNLEGGSWKTVWLRLTDIGSLDITRGLTVVGAIALLLMFRGRRYMWAPAAILVLTHAAEHTAQLGLKAVVDRGHPPTALGTWPSGGTARVLVVYGLLILFVVIRYFPRNPRAWALGWTLVAIATTIQMYARLNNLEHWVTDVIGGAIFGLMLLTLGLATYRTIVGRDEDTAPPVARSTAKRTSTKPRQKQPA